MYLKEKYPILTKQACEKIIDETIQEIDTGIPSDFSFQAIIREGRKPALAARMTSKVLVFQRARLGQDGLISIEGTQRYLSLQDTDKTPTALLKGRMAYRQF